ncbi:hypothetical protein [Bradyrhizobium sp. SEMIA]|uniref:hypothetical protein n=1 Tax=Bradyrhizobium sp. SEMIA TaxID=2597515 RepID=UPI0018A3B004|nr:hypothetical protein [Bradyrhizobium sp. SEMIA]QOG20456.1 hypothetical protein FOM02_26985 [Bradyrhizobium sp. SEMIA]
MRSLVEILTPAPSSALTTLARVKGELDIKIKDDDEVLLAKINEASSDIEAALGFRVPKEDVKETFWHDTVSLPAAPISRTGLGTPPETTLFLSRKKVRTIASVVVDDETLDPSEYRVDGDAGLLDRLDSNGCPCVWRFCKSVIVTMTAGYVLPGSSGRDLPYGIEGAVVALVSSYWASKGRDTTLRSEEIPGVIRRDYWVGAVGDPELLPPRILASLVQFRRFIAAVA